MERPPLSEPRKTAPHPAAGRPTCLDGPVERARVLLNAALGEWTARGLGPGLRHQLSGGKGLRPALSIWWGGRLGVPAAVAERWGLAVELLHNAFLIHDDIEDGDRYRRGRPTLWVEFGIPVALNVADHLLAEAYRTIAAIPAPPEAIVGLVRDFSETHRRTVEGQALDLDHRGNATFDLDDYERIIRSKTGRYLALTWVGPARVAGWSQDQLELLWCLGDELGPAFQIRDDVLDLTAGKGRGGEIGCDIREGKPSILVAHALSRAEHPPADRDRLLAILARERDETTEEETRWAIDLFEAGGSIAFALSEARRRAETGRTLLRKLPGLSEPVLAEFESIATFLIDRKA